MFFTHLPKLLLSRLASVAFCNSNLRGAINFLKCKSSFKNTCFKKFFNTVQKLLTKSLLTNCLKVISAKTYLVTLVYALAFHCGKGSDVNFVFVVLIRFKVQKYT